ncbi:MAG: hypothetical protein Q9221_004656 [Calogaya cf. arnoldii]
MVSFISTIFFYGLWVATCVVSSPVPLQLDGAPLLLGTSEPLTIKLPSIVQQNATWASAWLDSSKPDKLSATYIVYNVPNTNIRLLISVWDQTLPQVHMGGVILLAMNKVDTRIQQHPEDENSVLDRTADPYWVESTPPGIIFGTWSTMATKRLTYGDLDAVIYGVWKAMYQKGKYNAASIEVQKKLDVWGPVGEAVIRRGRLTPQRSED